MKYISNHALYLTLAIALIVPVNVWALVDPWCTDGECTPYVINCWDDGGDVICLNTSTEHAVTHCINSKAVSKILAHHPDACRGTCEYCQSIPTDSK